MLMMGDGVCMADEYVRESDEGQMGVGVGDGLW